MNEKAGLNGIQVIRCMASGKITVLQKFTSREGRFP